MDKPMLANKFEDKKAVFPCLVQPKLDGVRCLFDGTLAWTRNLKEHKPHITKMLQDRYPLVNWPKGLVLDGELMLPNATFQETVSAVKKEYEISSTLQYHVYDCWMKDLPDLPFYKRMQIVAEVVEDFPVITTKLENLDEVERLIRHYMEEGYEGLIYRTPNGAYKHGRSGRDLLKYKKSVDENGEIVDVLDAEYQIVGAIEGQGKDVGTPIWVCRMSATDERTFKVRPMGTYEWRREAWANRLSYIGKMLTVKFQELTDDGIPRFPIGVEVRDYE